MKRLVPPSPQTTVAVSGGFDPIHKGHVRMIRAASAFGNVMVIANSDEWLMRKKGYVFMPFEERAEILENIKGVVSVHQARDDDDSVCESLRILRPTMFANGEIEKVIMFLKLRCVMNLELNCFGTLVEKRYNRRLG